MSNTYDVPKSCQGSMRRRAFLGSFFGACISAPSALAGVGGGVGSGPSTASASGPVSRQERVAAALARSLERGDLFMVSVIPRSEAASSDLETAWIVHGEDGHKISIPLYRLPEGPQTMSIRSASCALYEGEYERAVSTVDRIEEDLLPVAASLMSDRDTSENGA